jgi:hypothetical protein
MRRGNAVTARKKPHPRSAAALTADPRGNHTRRPEAADGQAALRRESRRSIPTSPKWPPMTPPAIIILSNLPHPHHRALSSCRIRRCPTILRNHSRALPLSKGLVFPVKTKVSQPRPKTTVDPALARELQITSEIIPNLILHPKTKQRDRSSSKFCTRLQRRQLQ